MDPAAPRDSRIGSILAGRYRLDAVLGRGGMGVVYRATHTVTGRVVAIKLLAGQLSEDEHVMERFRREAQAAVKLVHPNVVEVFDLGTAADGTAYMVLELLEGQSLDQHLARESVLTPRETYELLKPIMSALATAHRAGLVHRDVKPANIFLHTGPDGRVVPKLLDFGIVKDLTATTGARTQTGVILGSPFFMAPEQVEGEPVGPETDVWAMGVVFYRCLSGHLPFAGDSHVTVMVSISTGRFPPLHKIAPTTPFALTEVIERALRVDRKERYADMTAFLEAMEHLVATVDLDESGAFERTPQVSRPAISEELENTNNDLPRPPEVARARPARSVYVVPPREPSGNRTLGITFALVVLAGAAYALHELGYVRFGPQAAVDAGEVTSAPAFPDAAMVATATRAKEPVQNEAWAAAIVAQGRARNAMDLVVRANCELQRSGAPPWRAVEALVASADEAVLREHYENAVLVYTTAKQSAEAVLAQCRGRVRDAGVAVSWRHDAGFVQEITVELEQVQAPRRDNKAAKAHYDRAITLKGMGDHRGAISELDRAIENAPDFVAAINSRAILHQATGELARALEDFDRALELEPRNASLYNNRGLARQARNDLFGAAEDFSVAIDLDPKQALFYQHRAAIRVAMGRRDLAIEDLTKAILIEPTADAFFSRGVAREDILEHAAALEDFDRVIELTPRRADAYYHRGRAKMELGRTEEAIGDFGKAIERSPKHAAAHFRRGMANARLGRKADAIRDLTRALELEPRSPHGKAAQEQLDRLGGSY